MKSKHTLLNTDFFQFSYCPLIDLQGIGDGNIQDLGDLLIFVAMDGYPDICATYTWGSGIIDSRIVVCDYVNGTSYEISGRGQYDYYLRLNNVDGGLYVDKKLYRSNEILSSARLIFKNGCIHLDGANAVSKTILHAKLIEIHDGYFLVEAVEGSSELSSACYSSRRMGITR